MSTFFKSISKDNIINDKPKEPTNVFYDLLNGSVFYPIHIRFTKRTKQQGQGIVLKNVSI